MIPETDAEHQALIGKAMLIAANIQIFGPVLAAVNGLLVIVFLVRRRS